MLIEDIENETSDILKEIGIACHLCITMPQLF